MKRYDRIPIWDTKKRLDILSEFHDSVVDYFEHSDYSWKAEAQIESKKAIKARVAINFGMQTARKLVAATGVPTSVSSGEGFDKFGDPLRIDILPNLFILHKLDVEPATAMDLIQCAMGVYDDDTGSSWRRTLNPFWWLGRFIIWLARLPFFLIGAAGFDAEKAEHSFIGRLVSLTFAVTTFVGAVLGILDRLGLLDELKVLIGLTQ